MFFYGEVKGRSPRQWRNLGKASQQRLREQRIVPGEPGTILKDIDTMIEFIGPGGLPTQSRNAALPAERLPELNGKVSQPIVLELKRPLLRDYPNLAGLFVLLRVMELIELKGNRLVLNATALAFWRSLNPTEQYFALLEALLFEAQSSVLSAERIRGEEEDMFGTVLVFLGLLNESWRDFDWYESVYTLGAKGELRPWALFLLQQLGLIEMRPQARSKKEAGRGDGQGWHIGGARLTPWGTAVTWALMEFVQAEEAQETAAMETESAAFERGQAEFELGDGTESARAPTAAAEPGEAEEEMEWEAEETPPEGGEEEAGPETGFGVLQPMFQPFFPEWQQVYERPERAGARGTYVFKVRLGRWQWTDESVWRTLEVPAGISLAALAAAILAAFKFDNDHLYDFRYRDRRGKRHVYYHPASSEGPFTTDVTVGETDLAVKEEMVFKYDYGDNWRFKVRLEKILESPGRLRKPKVVERVGKAPKQYSGSDW